MYYKNINYKTTSSGQTKCYVKWFKDIKFIELNKNEKLMSA
ncbi:hypothetical protein [Spiroplasma endosymbiont of Polydrusus pterygomalis]